MITERFSKLTKALPTPLATETIVPKIFAEDWVSSYRIFGRVSTDDRPRLTFKFLSAVCAEQGVKALATGEYHPQTNAQVEIFNRTLGSRPRHYFAEHQRDTDTFLYTITYAYRLRVDRSTRLPLFSLMISPQPCGRTVLKPFNYTDISASDLSMATRTRLIRRANMLRILAGKDIKSQKARYKAD